MASFHVKPGQCFTIGGSTVIQITEDEDYELHLSVDAPEDVSVTRGRRKSAGKRAPKSHSPAASVEELRAQFSGLVKELAAAMPPVDTPEWKELTGELVSELTFAITEQGTRQRRKARQAEGIAAAKSKGIQFGRARTPLPENFEEMRRAWRNKEISLRVAAEGCGMAPSTFSNVVKRVENEEIAGNEADVSAKARETHSARRSQDASRPKAGVSSAV